MLNALSSRQQHTKRDERGKQQQDKAHEQGAGGQKQCIDREDYCYLQFVPARSLVSIV